MPKDLDKQVLSTMAMEVVKDTFKKMLQVEFSAPPFAVEKNIIEYKSRMRVSPMEKFNAPAYVSYVNFYLSQKDLQAETAVGTFILCVKDVVVEKLSKAFKLSSKDAENENLQMDNVAEFCNILAGNVSNELTKLGYANLFMSAPYKGMNAIPEGVPFDYALYSKQEISFFFWNEKCMVVELCIGRVPLRQA